MSVRRTWSVSLQLGPLSASVDRTAVSVGDAVTLKVTVKGTGNVRNVQPPTLPPLPGWKSYEPKTDVTLDGAGTALLNFVDGLDLADIDASAALLLDRPRVEVRFHDERHGRMTDFHFRLKD